MNKLRRWFGATSIMLAWMLGAATAYAEGPPVETGATYKVVASSLNVREEPAEKATVIGSLQNGDLVVVQSESFGWYQVNADRLSGWVAGYYLKKSDGQPQAGGQAAGGAADSSADQADKPPAGGQATVTADALRIREEPGTDQRILTLVYEGESLDVLEARDGWLRVKTADGVAGWASAAYIATGSGNKPQQEQPVQAGSLQGRTIVIDPGHGGNDPGMIGHAHQTQEKIITLQTSNYLADELRRMGAHVVLTRTKDEEKPALAERVRISDEARADAFVSIHYNSSPKDVSGTLTFYYSDKDERLARAIEGRLAPGIDGVSSNGISFGDYHVLRENGAPSALVELGFLSNKSDEETVRTEAYQKKAAAAIARGLADFFRK